MDELSPDADGSLSLSTARRQLGSYAVPVDRTDRIPLSVAVGRVLATDATAVHAVPEAALRPDDPVFASGHQVRPGDVGLLEAAGVSEVLVRQRPQVGIVPTGDELVARDPGPDQRVETTGFTLAQYVDRWGGKVTYRNVVPDDAPALRAAVQRDLTRDIVVVTGTDPGDTLRGVVADLGEVTSDGIAMTPGGDSGLAIVEDRPVILLPEPPVDARVAAVKLLRPLLKGFADAPLVPHPETTATLTAGIETDTTVHAVVPVSLDDDAATPLAGTDLDTATRADGWVAVESGNTGPAAGTAVAVQHWEYLP